LIVSLAADTRIAGTEIAVRKVFRQNRLSVFDSLTPPGPVLTMSSNDDPFFT
jgi:hypothetical protein